MAYKKKSSESIEQAVTEEVETVAPAVVAPITTLVVPPSTTVTLVPSKVVEPTVVPSKIDPPEPEIESGLSEDQKSALRELLKVSENLMRSSNNVRARRDLKAWIGVLAPLCG